MIDWLVGAPEDGRNRNGTAKSNDKTLAHSKAALFPRRRRTRNGQEKKETARVHEYSSISLTSKIESTNKFAKEHDGLDKTSHASGTNE